jgi:hypothetical protein
VCYDLIQADGHYPVFIAIPKETERSVCGGSQAHVLMGLTEDKHYKSI